MTKKKMGLLGIALGTVVILGTAMMFLVRDQFDVPFTSVQQNWAIGIYAGQSPLALGDGTNNPVLTKSDVGDDTVTGVADPFLFADNEDWFIFFEVIREEIGAPKDEHGVIGVASSDDRGRTWRYDGVVLEEPFHLSYPQVFEHDGSRYMIPETLTAGRVSLYRSDDFPRGWSAQMTLLDGDYTDPTLFHHDQRWWLFVAESGAEPDDTLRLFHADELTGPWIEHPQSPVISGDISKARPAGGVAVIDGELHRFTQDNRNGYGEAVRAFRIVTLTDTEYLEMEAAEAAVLTGSGSGWNADGMHHIAAVQLPDGSWMAAVDGFQYTRVFGLKY